MSGRGGYRERDRSPRGGSGRNEDSDRRGGGGGGPRGRGSGGPQARRRDDRSQSPARRVDRGDRREYVDRDRDGHDGDRSRRPDERRRDGNNRKRSRSRSRSPPRRRDRSRDIDERRRGSRRDAAPPSGPSRRSPSPRRRDRGHDSRRPTEKMDVDTRASQEPGEDTEGGVEGDEDAAERRMMAMMGFGGFDTTKGKSVDGNQSGAAKVNKQRTWRQYMNRRGGFNRPLDKIK